MAKKREQEKEQELLRVRLGMDSEDLSKVLGGAEKDSASRLGMSPEEFGKLTGQK